MVLTVNPKQIVLLGLLGAATIADALYTSSDPNDTTVDGAVPEFTPRSVVDLFGDLTARELDTVSYATNSTHNAERSLDPRTVYSPKITSPSATTVWVAGNTAKVTWDPSSLPKHGGPFTGSIALGYLLDGSENEHLDVGHPLAQGVDLSQGSIDVKVPLVQPGNDYIIVLFGDSGNRSPTFTIN